MRKIKIKTVYEILKIDFSQFYFPIFISAKGFQNYCPHKDQLQRIQFFKDSKLLLVHKSPRFQTSSQRKFIGAF